MTARWISVHAGSIWEVQLYQGRLEEEGLTTFVPDESTKVVDPFATGGLPLMAALHVPSDQVERAQAILATMRDHAPVEPDEHLDEVFGEASPDEDDEAPSPAEQKVEHLATRTRWAALWWITFPFAFVTGFLYLRASKKHGIKSKSHGLTLAAIGFAVLNLAGIIAFAYFAV